MREREWKPGDPLLLPEVDSDAYGPNSVPLPFEPAEPEPISDHEGGNGADRTYEPTTARTTTGPAEPERAT